MGQPVISTSSPASNAVDVFLNVPLTLTFAAPGLVSTSVTENSVVLLNVGTQTSVPVSLSYNSATYTITITPLSVLAESTVYKIRLPGTDVAISSSYVILESGTEEALTSTIDITFTTGTRLFIDDSVVAKDALDLSLEGDLSLPSNVKALGPFAVETTFPKNHSADVNLSLDGNNRFYVKFNKELSGSIQSDDWATCTTFPIMDMNKYLAASGVFGDGALPNLTGMFCSGQYLYLGFDNEFPNNAGVQLELGTGITATDGSMLGNNNFVLSFTTDRFPKVAGVHVMRNELKAAGKVMNDDYIAAMLLKNTVRVINRWAPFSQTSPQYVAYKYILNQTIMDVLEDVDLDKAIIAGTSKRLGDMAVSYDQAIGEATLKYQRAKEEAELADDAMMGIKKLGSQISYAIIHENPVDRAWKGVNGRLINYRFKFYQEAVPMSNIDLNRTAGNPNFWYI